MSIVHNSMRSLIFSLSSSFYLQLTSQNFNSASGIPCRQLLLSLFTANCECFLPTPFEKDEQKSITTGSRTCCYKINKLAFQAIGLLILFVRNWPCLKTEILTILYHLPSHPPVVIIGSIYTHDH
jgi:hypothetical protein